MSAFLLEDLGQNAFPRLFQLLEITCIPCWWLLPTSKPATADQVFSHGLLRRRLFCLLPPQLKGPFHYIGSYPENPGQSLYLKVNWLLTLVPLAV